LTLPEQAIIFAAGLGSRLGPYTQNIPKTLLNLGSTTIFDMMIVGLEKIGVQNVTVVTGYQASKLRQHATTISLEQVNNKVHFDFIQNDNLDAGNIYSFWLARNKMTKNFFLLNSDVLFDYGILDLLVANPNDSALVIDNHKILGQEEMKVSVSRGGVIKSISKQLDPSVAAGEYIGIMKLSSDTAERVLDKVELLLSQKRYPLYYEDAFELVAQESECLWTCSTKGLPWTEIDTMEDLNFARDTVLTKLRSILGPPVS